MLDTGEEETFFTFGGKNAEERKKADNESIGTSHTTKEPKLLSIRSGCGLLHHTGQEAPVRLLSPHKHSPYHVEEEENEFHSLVGVCGCDKFTASPSC
jgi:hypothetical protein